MGHIGTCNPRFTSGFCGKHALTNRSCNGNVHADLEKVIYFAGLHHHETERGRKNFHSKDLDSEYKIKVKNLQDEKSKEAVKELLINAKNEIETFKKE